MGLDYAIKNQWNKLTVDHLNNFKTKWHIQELAVKLYRTKNHFLQWKSEFYLIKNKTSQNSMLFSDILYRYTFQKHKIDLECEIQNLFNYKYFTMVTAETFLAMRANLW